MDFIKIKLDFTGYPKEVISTIVTICMIASCLLVFPAKGFAQSSLPSGYRSAARSSSLELYINAQDGTIAVKDLRNGYIWKSVVDETIYNIGGLNQQWQNYLRSMFVVNYIDLSKRDTPPNRTYSSAEGTIVQVRNKEKGVEIEYVLEPIGISVTVEFSIEGDQFVAKIPADKIKESPVIRAAAGGGTTAKETEVQYGIVSIEFLPFFGAATNEYDGYLMYPDGPGGLTLYSEVTNRPADVKVGKWKIYSTDKVDIQGLFGEDGERYRASLPVFGVKNNNNGFLVAITKGIEESGITAYPSGYVVDINHINFDFIYRYHYEIAMSNISIDNNSIGKTVQRAEKNLLPMDKEIRFFMLHDDRANYSEMANVYRAYLMENGILKDRVQAGSEVPMSLQVFMGITEQQMLFNKFIPMTTVEQTLEMTKELTNKGVRSLQMILRGWQKGGVGQYPNNWPFDSRLGKPRNIYELNEYVKTNGIDVYLENCFDYARGDVGGFSARNDVVLDGSQLPVTSKYSKSYLLNPTAAARRHETFLRNLSAYEGFQVAYEDLGKVIYFDYHKTNPSTRQETVRKWQEILQTARSNGRKTAVDGANQYVFADADLIYNIPTKTFGYFITDKEIPFLQMVLYGMIPYAAEPGNLSFDLQYQKLKWVEYGAVPSFELTKESPLKLKNTFYSHLFTSSFDYWQEEVVSTYKEFNDRLGAVYGSQMISHEEIAPKLIKILYSNGYKIFINYNDFRFSAEGIRIPAKDYVVITERGEVR